MDYENIKIINVLQSVVISMFSFPLTFISFYLYVILTFRDLDPFTRVLSLVTFFSPACGSWTWSMLSEHSGYSFAWHSAGMSSVPRVSVLVSAQ